MSLYDGNGNIINVGGTSESKFKGKNIIWLGDSIHAYSTPDGVTIPYLFGYNTGAKCYNWCQGGMTMALMNIPNYDCYSGVGMINAIVNKDFTVQETYAHENHGTSQGNFLEQVAEMKSLDYSKVDYLVIEFGTNDVLKDVTLDNSENEFDTSTTGGALRYMIKTIQTAYPKLKVIVLNVQKMTGWLDAEHSKSYDSKKQNEVINQVCEEMCVPLIDMYRLLGLNEYTSTTLLRDGLHRTHEGKLRQKNIIENQMNYFF